MTIEQTPITTERRAELLVLAHELARQTAWDMALEDQAVSDQVIERIERETLDRLLAANV